MFTIVKIEFGQVVDYYFYSCETIEDAIEKVKYLREANCGYDYLIKLDEYW